MCVLDEDDSQRVLKMMQDADTIIMGAPCYWGNKLRGAIRAMREICRYSGFKIVATIERGGTAMHLQLSEKDKQKCLKAIGKV